MEIFMRPVKRPLILALLPIAALLAACENSGSNYVPVIDGATGPNYQADLAACQQLAAQQPALGSNAGVNTAAAAGTAAATTAIVSNQGNNVLDAAIVGTVAGLAGSAVQQNQAKADIVSRCMSGRGYKVIG